MTQQSQAERILAKFPSERRLAAALGLRQQTVNGWKKVGWVPAWHQKDVLLVAKKMNIELHPADFFELDNGDDK